MAIQAEHHAHGSQAEEKKNVHTEETSELVSAKDRMFKAPKSNAFGQSFRDYDIESERQKGVEEFYRLQHINQTYDFLLNEVVDDSDPDLDEPQIQHLLQTAEAIRKDYPNEDWLHLTALIHDLGKILHLPQFGELPQWAVVGDTFPVGCAFDEKNVHHKYFKENPDSKNPAYNTKDGVYSKGCGLDNVLMSWGHDDYMYMVAKENGTTLPSPGLFIIRYHSFYRKTTPTPKVPTLSSSRLELLYAKENRHRESRVTVAGSPSPSLTIAGRRPPPRVVTHRRGSSLTILFSISRLELLAFCSLLHLAKVQKALLQSDVHSKFA
ncbi:hypothetical protein AHAS_Ahas13G0095300 [Arachis hypogaea]